MTSSKGRCPVCGWDTNRQPYTVITCSTRSGRFVSTWPLCARCHDGIQALHKRAPHYTESLIDRQPGLAWRWERCD